MSSGIMIVGVALIFVALVVLIAAVALSPRGDVGVNRSMAVLLTVGVVWMSKVAKVDI